MTEEEIRKAVAEQIPGAVVEATIVGRAVKLSVAAESPTVRKLMERVNSALDKAGVSEHYPAINMHCCTQPDQWWKVRVTEVVKALVEDVVASKGDGALDVELSQRDLLLTILVTSRAFGDPGTARQAKAHISTSRDRLLEMAGAQEIAIEISDGMPSFPAVQPSFDEEDEDESNPNWPSKTGNPSGRGRGNNPPRR